MNRVPVWLRVVIIVIIVLVVVALAVPRFLALDRFRPAIAQQLSQATGRPVTLGAIQAHVLPSIGFRVNGLSIGNPAGFPRGAFVQVRSIQGGLAFWPLLRGRIQVTSLLLDHPAISLLTNASGAGNDQFPASQSSPSAASSSSLRTAIDRMDLRDLRVESAQVLPNGKISAPVFQLSGLTLRLRDLRLGGSVLQHVLADANLAGVRLSVSALASPITFKSGAFALRAGELQGQCLADLGPAGQARLQFHSADIERPPVQFGLYSSDLRLDRLLAAAPAGSSPTQASVSSSVTPSHTLLANGTLMADRLSWAPYQASAAKASLRIYSDGIELSPAQLNFAGGTLNAAFVQTQRLAITLKAANIGIAGLFPANPDLARRLSGRGALQLTANGPSGDALLPGLVGAGQFQFANLQLKNSPVIRQLAQLAMAEKILGANVGAAASGDLAVGSLRGDLEIAHSRVASKLIQAQTALGTIDLTGSLGFDQTLAYTGTVHFGAAPAASAAPPAPQTPSGLLGALSGALSGKNPTASLKSQLLRRVLNLRLRITGTLAQPRLALVP